MKIPSGLVALALGWVCVVAANSASAAATVPRRADKPNPPPRQASLEAPNLRVLPWNGHRAALTLTFDDGSPSDVEEAVPTLDEKGVKGTFFVTERNTVTAFDTAAWAYAGREGHELANHTVDHCSGDELGRGKCLSARGEIERDNRYIERTLGAPGVFTFAYPYVNEHGGYKRVAEEDFLLSRAGKGGLVDSEATPDWYSMDAKFIEPTHGETLADWNGWIDQADEQSKWLILVFHSILPENWCEGIPRETLGAIVDHAKASNDLWIDTFVNVGAYLRAQRMFEAVRPMTSAREVAWRWTLPRHFPHGRSLRVVVDHGALRQNGVELSPDAAGTYAVALDARELEWTPRSVAPFVATNKKFR